jgi:hypothetical protein
MANIEFDRQDIEGLAQKLSTLWPVFSDVERALLLAIFAVAADRAKPATPDRPATLPRAATPASAPAPADYEATLAYLQQQLLRAYIPGNSFNSVVPEFNRRIGGTPPPPPPPPPPPGPGPGGGG